MLILDLDNDPLLHIVKLAPLAVAARLAGAARHLRGIARDNVLARLKRYTPESLLALSLGDAAKARIRDAPLVSGVIVDLNLRTADLDSTGAVTIAEVLRGNEVLKTLWLSGNNIGDEGAVAIADALRVNAVLKSIDLRYNELGDEGKGAIRDAVSGRVGFELEM